MTKQRFVKEFKKLVARYKKESKDSKVYLIECECWLDESLNEIDAVLFRTNGKDIEIKF